MALVAASHTPSGRCRSDPALGIVEFTTGDPDATFYVDDRNAVKGYGVWVYQESNFVWTSQGPGVHTGDITAHNLQRGNKCGSYYGHGYGVGVGCIVADGPEICYDDIRSFSPDSLVI